jgi:DNA repair protein RadC
MGQEKELKAMPQGDHSGHRERLKQKYLDVGVDAMLDIEVLELLLFYALPRCDTRPIAYQLLRRFGAFHDVLDAPLEELCKVPGVSKHTAILLSMIPSLGKRHIVQKNQQLTSIMTIDAAAAFLIPLFYYEEEEVVYLMCLDAKCQIIDCGLLARGSFDSVVISVREIASRALACKASTVILAHNHVSGYAVPSAADQITTRKLQKALGSIDIVLADHLVVSGDDYTSMAASGVLDEFA